MNFGTSARKLSRRTGHFTSKVAAALLNTSELEEMVYFTIRSFGKRGCTQEEVLKRHVSYPYPSITARFSALLDKDLVVDTGERRLASTGRKQRVLRAVL